MINEKIFFNKGVSHPSIFFIYTSTPENLNFLNKILKIMNYPLNSFYSTESLNIFQAIPNNNNLYYFISLSLDSSLSKNILKLKPYMNNANNVFCLLISSNFSFYQAFWDESYPLFSHFNCIYITYTLEIFSQRLFLKEKEVNYVTFDHPKQFLELVFELKNSNQKDYYLSKKKIFTIEKIKREHHQSFKSLNDACNDDDDSNREDVDGHSNSKNSLISISKEVYKFVKSKSVTQGNDVTKYVIDILLKSGQQVKYKNIQRRVYDAINVMSAIGLLLKDRGKISFVKAEKPNKLTNSHEKNINDETINITNNDELNERIAQLNDSIKEKKELLIEQCCQNMFYKKFIQLNQTDIKRTHTVDKLDFPFHIIILNSESEYHIKEDDFNHRVVILSNKPFQILYPEHLIKFFVQNDFTINNIQHYFSKEIVKYIVENKLIENYFSSDRDEMPIICKREKRNSFSFGHRLFEPISILDSESNFNMYPGMDMRKGSEDIGFNTFMMMKNDELFDGNENLERNYSNYLSPSFYSKH